MKKNKRKRESVVGQVVEAESPVTLEAQIQAEKDVEDLDEIINADERIPVTPTYRCAKNKGWQYYLSVRGSLREWWEEFNTEQNKAGGLRYRTTYQFAKEKGKTPVEVEYIEEMIGRKPQLKDGRLMLRVPWLGDWQQRRANGWSLPEQPKKIKALAQAIKDKVVNWDAVRSAAPYLVYELARYTRMSQQVEAAFAGEMFDQQKSPDDVTNRSRSNFYFELQEKITNLKIRLLDQWMLVHGVNPKDPVYYTQVNTLAQQISVTPEGLAGMGAGDMPVKQLEILKLARHLQAHAETFEMPLPESVLPTAKEPQPQPQVKGKGQVQ